MRIELLQFLQILGETKMCVVENHKRMLVAQEKESKLSLDRTLAAIDKVTSESLDG